MKERLKRALASQSLSRRRALTRVRWITKYRLMRALGAEVPFSRRLSYVLMDPETESFSYELADRSEVIAALARALGREESELLGYAAEVDRDPELHDRLEAHVRRRLDVKHHLPLGHRLVWYVIARAFRPETIVETGTYLGLGSLALLRALDRNRRDGHPGRLISIDVNPDAGSIVRDDLTNDWHRITGLTHDVLLPALEGRRIGMLLQDTPHTEENQRFEFTAALSHAADRLVLIDGSGGWADTLKDLCAERGGIYHRVPVRSRDHVYPGLDITFAVFEQ